MRISQLLVLMASVALAQMPARKTATAPATPTSTAVSIPRTDDIELLMRRLRASGPKSEFESTQQYQDRMAKAVQPNKAYVFAVDYGGSFAYDADAETMTATIEIEPKMVQPDYLTRGTISIVGRTEHEEQRMGVNGYGARAVIKSRTWSECGIVPTEPSVGWLRSFIPATKDLPDWARTSFMDRYPYSVSFSFPMAVELAKAVKSKIRILLVGTVLGGQVYLEDEFYPATLSDPVEVTAKRYYLNFAIDELRIVDGRTGQALMQVKPIE